jgi:hypothetical protein
MMMDHGDKIERKNNHIMNKTIIIYSNNQFYTLI